MIKHWLASVCALAVVSIPSHAAPPAAMQHPDPTQQELAWIGLFNDDLVGWLENENRLKDLCGAPEGSEEWSKCREEKLEPKALVIPVRSEPRPDARRLGEILIIARPGRGLSAFSSADHSKRSIRSDRTAIRFTPDLFDSDWGYGPWFHQTILARRGTWFRIPVPSIGPGWINAEDWNEPADFPANTALGLIKTVDAEDILTTPRGDMYVLGVENRVLRVRPEQDADMWCGGEQQPPLKSWQEVRIPFSELLDSKGHLLLKHKYHARLLTPHRPGPVGKRPVPV